MQEPIVATTALNGYIEHLSEDPVLKKLLAGQEQRQLKKSDNLTFFLYSTIVKQQLSTRVGEVLLSRFLQIYNGHEPSSAEVLATPVEAFRAIGISGPKAGYIKNVAQFDLDNGINNQILDPMTDEEVTAYITRIKGIGKWTAHIFLMAALGREDVFPADDLILQKAIASIYNLDRIDKKKFMEAILALSAKWSPYRSFASLHLWRWDGEKGN